MPFNVQQARQSGATDDQIMQFLSEKANFDLNGAKQAGASNEQIIEFLANKVQPVQAPPQQEAPSFQDVPFQGPQPQLAEGVPSFQDIPMQMAPPPSNEPPVGIPLSETPIEQLLEVGAAPELNELSMRAIKGSLAASLMLDPKEFARAIPKIIPGSEARTDEAGNLRIKFPSGGEFAINKPGLSGQDLIQFATRLAAFSALPVRAGLSAGAVGRVAAETAGAEAGAQAVEAGLGGEFDTEDVALTGAGGVVGQTIGVAAQPLLRPVARKAKGAIEGAKNLLSGTTNKRAKEVLINNAPTRETLRTAAREIYDQVDAVGVQVTPTKYQALVKKIEKKLQEEGMSELTPKAAQYVEILKNEPIDALTVSRIEILRRQGSAVRGNLDPTESNLGRLAVSQIDDFLENMDKNIISKEGIRIDGKTVGAALKEARSLWSRQRASKAIQEAVEIADTRRSGTDLGLRNEFANIHRKIIRGRLRGFNKNEIDAIKQVSKGGDFQNMVFQLGRLGIPEDQATNSLLTTMAFSLGGAGGFAAGGPTGALAGAIAGVAIPSVFRRAATRMTSNNAKLADAMVRTGGEGIKIVRAYLKATPKKSRKSAEIAALLLKYGNKPETMSKTGNHLIDNAIFAVKNATAIEAQQQKEQ